jgi:hypothetical protein
MWGKPSKPIVSKAMNRYEQVSMACKPDVNTSRQTHLGYNMHFWGTNCTAKPHQKGAKTIKNA